VRASARSASGSFAHRRQRDARGQMQDRDAARTRLLLDLRAGLLRQRLGAVLQRLTPAAIVLGLESRRDRRAQFLDQRVHVAAQIDAAARGQAQRHRPAPVVCEVEHVAPVVGARGVGRAGGEVALHQGLLADAGRADGEDVVAGAPQRHPEGQRLARPGLHRGEGPRRKIGGGREAERRRIADPPQRLGRHARGGHAAPGRAAGTRLSGAGVSSAGTGRRGAIEVTVAPGGCLGCG
jgi:hypothetical protein